MEDSPVRTVRAATQEIVKIGLAPMLKRHRFKKQGFNFSRRQGTVEHHFNVQLSQWNHGARGYFFLNGGVLFDDMLRLRGGETPKSPKCHHCQFYIRLGTIDPRLIGKVDVDKDTDLASLAHRLTEQVEKNFVVPLNGVWSTKDFLATGWVDKIPWDFPAVFHYLAGNKAEARRRLELQAKTFADRGCTFQSLANHHHLSFSEDP
jgi:hypothetical protein